MQAGCMRNYSHRDKAIHLAGFISIIEYILQQIFQAVILPLANCLVYSENSLI